MQYSRSLLFFIFISIFVIGAYAQDAPRAPETSYDVVLQIVIGGDDKANMPLPQNLGTITKQLKTNYPYADYKLANTYVGRIGTNGNLEYKSISNVFGQTQQTETPTFWEWSISTLRSPQTGNNLLMNGFRFGAKVPVRTGTTKDGSGSVQPIFSYENIGITAMRLIVVENSPTLIGSLALPNSTGTAFLVLTLRPA